MSNRFSLPIHAGVLLAAGLFLSIAGQDADAGETPAMKLAQDADPRIDRTWLREWEDFAVFYAPFEDGYVCFPEYSPDRPSNETTSVSEYIRRTSYEARFRDELSRARSIVISKPVEDAQAALWLLDDPQPGSYGYISTGAIETIVDHDEMILRSVLLLDGALVNEARQEESQAIGGRVVELAAGRNRRDDAAERRRAAREIRELLTEAMTYRFADRQAALELQRTEAFRQLRWRIIGYSTDRLVVEERWPQGDAAHNGLHLAVVSVEEGVVTAIPVALLERDMTEIEFLEVIASRGYTKARFVELIMQMRREHRRDYVEHVLLHLEGLDSETQAEADPSGDEGGRDDGDGSVNDTVELAD